MLQEKLDKLVKNQNMMKAVNAYYRKHKTLKGCQEFSEETAIKLEESLTIERKNNTEFLCGMSFKIIIRISEVLRNVWKP